jgi:hypothetical protein
MFKHILLDYLRTHSLEYGMQIIYIRKTDNISYQETDLVHSQ